MSVLPYLTRRNLYHFESFTRPGRAYEIIWFSFLSPQEIFILHCRYARAQYRKLRSLHVPVPKEFMGRLDSAGNGDHPWDRVKGDLCWIADTLRQALTVPADVEKYDFKNNRNAYLDDKIQKAKQYISEHFKEKIYVDQVAGHVGLAPNYFKTLFHQVDGKTFTYYVRLMRLREAHRLLNEGDMSISEIAYQCGFNDPYNFSRVFKKNYGLSPRLFRKEYRRI